MKRRILFDLTFYESNTAYHGGGEYGFRVLDTLVSQESCIVEAFINSRVSKYDDKLRRYCEKNKVTLFSVRDATDLQSIVLNTNYDTLYSPLPNKKYFMGLIIPSNTEFVFTIHGLRSIELFYCQELSYFDDIYGWRALRKLLYKTFVVQNRTEKDFVYKRGICKGIEAYKYLFDVSKNYFVVCVSKHSYYSINRYLPFVPKERLFCMYSPSKIAPIEIDRYSETEILRRYNVSPKKYSLIISANRATKNPRRSIQAWDLAYSINSEMIPLDFKTVVLGDCGKLKAVNNYNRFEFYDYIDDLDLEVLYKNAYVLFYGSLNEGFGYPPLEAMKYGTLVLASCNSSIPEIVGDAAILFNPFLVEEMVNRILQCFDEEICRSKQAKIIDQYKKISKRQEDDLLKLAYLLSHN